MIKRIMATVMTAGILLSFVPSTVMADTLTGWQGSDSNGWRYYTSDGNYVKNGWIKTGGLWYYFDASGYMKTGWIQDGGSWYYLRSSGDAVVNAWEKINGKLYHFNASGAMEADKWIAYDVVKPADVDNDSIVLPFQDAYKNKKMWRYVGSDGAAYTGWKIVDGKWYYFTKYDSPKEKNAKNGEDLNYIILNSNEDIYGAMRYGWLYDDDGSTYFFDENGRYQNSGWYRIKLTEKSDIWYYFGSDGRAHTGWEKFDGKWYHFTDSGIMEFGGRSYIDGKHYYFKPNGEMLTGWYKDEYGKWYYATPSGVLYCREWLKEDGKWYYFDSNARMVCNQKGYTINGTKYDFDSHGVCLNP